MIVPDYWIKKSWKAELSIEWRKRSSFMGRFGGGWNWCIGFELGSTSLIINCLVFMIRLSWGGIK